MDVNTSFEKVMNGLTLNANEARAIMLALVEGKVNEIKTAALLAGLRVRGEASEEIIGFARAMQEKALPLPLKKSYPMLVDTCGTGGDGLQTLNISTMVALLLASAGIPVAKHGNRSVSSSCGSADVLAKLGVAIDMPPERAAACLNEIGIAFLFAPIYHPAMKYVVPVRKAMGTRTLFNLLGPLVNPAPVTHQLVGVFSSDVQPLVANALLGLGLKAFMVVHASDGMDELSLSSPTKIIGKKTSEKNLFTTTITASEHGFAKYSKEEVLSDLQISTPEEGAARMNSLLGGNENGPASLTVQLNAAMAFLLVEKVKTLAEGAELVTLLIKQGKVKETLHRFSTFQ